MDVKALNAMSVEELTDLRDMVSDLIKRKGPVAWGPGDRVTFGRTNGKKHTGTIERINRTTATVKTDGFRGYRVPFSMLRRA